MEKYKILPQYKNYIIYDSGKIYSTKTQKYLKLSKNFNRRYCKIGLYNNITNKWDSFLLHRLIAITFIPNPDNKPHINHIDNDGMNNSVDNLEWCTPKENMRHSIMTGNFQKGIEKSKISRKNVIV